MVAGISAQGERWDISAQALELARRARALGLPLAAYLLEVAALEACPERERAGGDTDRRRPGAD